MTEMAEKIFTYLDGRKGTYQVAEKVRTEY